MEELMQVMKSYEDEYHQNVKDNYSDILYWEKWCKWLCIFFIIFFNLLFIVIFVVKFFREHCPFFTNFLWPLLCLTILFLFLVCLVAYIIREEIDLQTNKEEEKSCMVSDAIIEYLREKYKERASLIVIFLINDSIKKQNQRNSDKNPIFKDFIEILTLLVTSFISYSVGEVSTDGFKTPYYIVTVTILIFIGLFKVSKSTMIAFMKFHRESTQEHLLINILQDIKYKL
jgi:hypothetical protein